MNIHPQLRALRDDDAPQRHAQDALIAQVAAWRAAPRMAALIAQIADFAGGGEITEYPALAALFEHGSPAACELAHEVADLGALGLGEHPLGHVPFRHFTDDAIATLQLAKAGDVTLSLVALNGEGLAERPAPVTADFSPSQVWEHVLAGSARADRFDRGATRADHAAITTTRIHLAPGSLIVRDARHRAVQVREIDGCLVSLRLQRRLPDAGPTREYRLSDGMLVHQAAGNPQDSRTELMLALLGRMGRADAAPLLADIAREPGSAALRWQALRECLSLDSAQGFRALDAVASAADDDLAGAAGALRAQLVETYPQLQELVPCPA